MKLVKYFEFHEKDLEPIKSFNIKDELNPKVWEGFELDSEIRKQLLKIGEDFYEGTELEADVLDIVLVGSLCNYNWSEKYSDFDLHIIINYLDIDENYDLVKKTCNYAKKIWNKQHEIIIKNYEVEIALQDIKDLDESIETGKMGGVYSLLEDKWIKKPKKIEFEPDEDLISEKAKSIMMIVDDIEDEAEEDKYEAFEEKISKVWKKIKDLRKRGLEEGGEYSIGNLVFKLLRRNGYVGRIIELKGKIYDKQFK